MKKSYSALLKDKGVEYSKQRRGQQRGRVFQGMLATELGFIELPPVLQPLGEGKSKLSGGEQND